MRFRATVLSLILLLASVSLLAESLPDFSRRVLALRGRTPTLETAKYVLDSTTEGLMTDLSLINEVSTPGGAIGIELSWINDIVQDLRTETVDSRRHLYWKSFIDTLDGLVESLGTSAFGHGPSSAEIMAALRDAHQQVKPIRVCLAPGAGGEGGVPDAALDQYAEIPDSAEISAIRAEGGSFSGYGSRDLSGAPGGTSGGGFSGNSAGSPPAGFTTSSSSGSSPSTPTSGSSSSFGQSSSGYQPGSPGTKPFPSAPPSHTPTSVSPPPPPPPPPPAPQLAGSAYLLYWILGTLVAIVIVIVGFLIYRAWARSRALSSHKPLVLGSSALEDEIRQRRNVDLYQQALEEARKGNYEMGVRLMALAILLLLDQRGRLNFDKARTNGEYRLRILDEHPALGQVMDSPLRVFDRLYYGFRPSSETDFQEFRQVFDKLERNLT